MNFHHVSKTLASVGRVLVGVGGVLQALAPRPLRSTVAASLLIGGAIGAALAVAVSRKARAVDQPHARKTVTSPGNGAPHSPSRARANGDEGPFAEPFE